VFASGSTLNRPDRLPSRWDDKQETFVARVTVEDCLRALGNRFALVVLAAERARQLSKGARSLIECSNKPAVTALREIAAHKVRFNEDVREIIETYLDESRETNRRL